MTSAQNPQTPQNTQQPGPQPDLKQTIVVNIDQHLTDGMPVFDVNGEQVGFVKMYSAAAGYLIVGIVPLGDENLYIPFRLIRSIDPQEIYLTADKVALQAQYTQPPTITTVSETRMVPGPRGTLTPQTTHVQMVQSGYDAEQTAISRVDVGAIAQQLAVGMAVYDVDGERLGDITQYDTKRSLLVVEQGIFKPRVLFVPFSAIQAVGKDSFTVYLSLPRDVLLKEHAMLPADA
ncbi:MAG TPA: PRC-barrel domain-containing protein [Ktedonobacterales bacterium]|jgi:ribosomal 30S subunit maturation factor RimM|nr:PRC-barrel domain-containing protein [Ktedonobacterales bacterium]